MANTPELDEARADGLGDLVDELVKQCGNDPAKADDLLKKARRIYSRANSFHPNDLPKVRERKARRAGLNNLVAIMRGTPFEVDDRDRP